MIVVITMPAYNEEGITDFIRDLYSSFRYENLKVIVINDNSTDLMEERLSEMKVKYDFDIHIVNNIENLGHGPSTIMGLRESLFLNPDVVISIDGDGQFVADEIAVHLQTFLASDVEIIEGCRISRRDPNYRRVSSLVTRILVGQICRISPRDANTPLRIYKPRILRAILETINPNLLTPNLYISAFSRLKKFKIVEVEVTSLPRRGKTEIGTTWKQTLVWLPSKRFMVFCLRATRQWFGIIVPTLKSM
jgi:dolichol-phosphate mannosyltransferase